MECREIAAPSRHRNDRHTKNQPTGAAYAQSDIDKTNANQQNLIIWEIMFDHSYRAL